MPVSNLLYLICHLRVLLIHLQPYLQKRWANPVLGHDFTGVSGLFVVFFLFVLVVWSSGGVVFLLLNAKLNRVCNGFGKYSSKLGVFLGV